MRLLNANKNLFITQYTNLEETNNFRKNNQNIKFK